MKLIWNPKRSERKVPKCVHVCVCVRTQGDMGNRQSMEIKAMRCLVVCLSPVFNNPLPYGVWIRKKQTMFDVPKDSCERLLCDKDVRSPVAENLSMHTWLYNYDDLVVSVVAWEHKNTGDCGGTLSFTRNLSINVSFLVSTSKSSFFMYPQIIVLYFRDCHQNIPTAHIVNSCEGCIGCF